MLKVLVFFKKKMYTINNKMVKKINIYQQLNLKSKLSKQEQRQNHGCRERFDGCQMGGWDREGNG